MSDPIRLSDPRSNSSLALRNLIRAGQKELPDERQLGALALHLGPALGVKLSAPTTAAASALGGAKAGVAWVAAAKLGAAGVVMLGLVSAVYVQEYRLTAPRIEPPPEKSVATAYAASRTVPTAGDVPTSPARLAPAAGAGPTTRVAPEQEPTREVSARPALATESPLARTPETPTSEPIPSPSPAEIPSPAQIANPPPESELALLQRAGDRLRSDPAGALDLAEQHAERFPSGALAQEREVIAIEALVGLHRDSEARDRAQHFVRDFPGSAHRLHIQSLMTDEDPAKPDHNP
jgi:hypothetical protein